MGCRTTSEWVECKKIVAMTATLAIAIMALFSRVDILDGGDKPKASGAATPDGAICCSVRISGTYTTHAVVQTPSVNIAKANSYTHAAVVQTATASTCNGRPMAALSKPPPAILVPIKLKAPSFKRQTPASRLSRIFTLFGRPPPV